MCQLQYILEKNNFRIFIEKMNHLFYLFILTVLCTACGPNVAFVNPQPIFLDNLQEIPNEYHGEFLDLKYPEEDPIKITKNSIEISGISLDSFVVKSQGNYLYFNILNPDGYFELYITRISSLAGQENVQLIAPSIDSEELKYFDLKFIKYNDDEIEDYILGDLNINQLNLYRKLGYEDFIKNERFSSQYIKIK